MGNMLPGLGNTSAKLICIKRSNYSHVKGYGTSQGSKFVLQHTYNIVLCAPFYKCFFTKN
jgi:hypothetical protein